MLSKEELMQTLWPDSFVEESNLTQQVSMIRRALGESASNPRYIATVPSRGYRFIAEVRNPIEVEPASDLRDLHEVVDRPRRDLGEQEESGKDTTSVTQSQSPKIEVLKERQRITVALRTVLTGLVFLLILASAVLFYRRHSLNVTQQPNPRRLAILPLQNLRQAPADDFLGFSLADAIITKLDYVSSLTLRPSKAVEKYRKQEIDIQKVGSELNVDTLLTGSFIHDRDKLRITYQLIDVNSDKLLGRGTIDLKYGDLLTVQDNVAKRIIKDLELNLSPSEAERIKPDAPVNPLAYEYYLRGVDLHSRHKFPVAIKMLEKSTEIDSGYAPAWAYLGASYNSDAAFEFGGREQYRRAQAAYERALAVQPSLLDAQIFLANLLIDTGKVEQAVPLLREALKTNPNHADAHWELGYAYRFAGMLEESVAECERARQLDPEVKSNGSALNAYLYLGEYDKFLRSLPDVNDSLVVFYRGFGEYHQGRWDQAAKDFDRAFDLEPHLYTQIGKAFSDSIAHRNADGLEILHLVEGKIRDRGVGDPEATYKIAQAYAVLGDKVSALRALRSSVDGGFFSYPYLLRDPMLASLRGGPEFEAILNSSNQRYRQFREKFF
jgi:TolB-like protein/Tfp pilus assembly protein PilF